MITKLKIAAGAIALTATLAGIPALQAQAPAKHHSILKGAGAGAVAGHVTHRKHGALIGAGVGAEVQHHRNKKAARMAKPAGK